MRDKQTQYIYIYRAVPYCIFWATYTFLTVLKQLESEFRRGLSREGLNREGSELIGVVWDGRVWVEGGVWDGRGLNWGGLSRGGGGLNWEGSELKGLSWVVWYVEGSELTCNYFCINTLFYTTCNGCKTIVILLEFFIRAFPYHSWATAFRDVCLFIYYKKIKLAK